MLKRLIVCCLVISLSSCDKNKAIDGYFYDENSDRIFKFNTNKSALFRISDSSFDPFNYKVINNDVLILNEVDYSYKNYTDSLVFYNYESKKLTLKKFSIDNISIDDLKSTSWTYDMSKPYKNHDLLLLEQMTLSIDNDLNLYLIQNKDTLFGYTHSYSGRIFDIFPTFKQKNNKSNNNLIPIHLSHQELVILIPGSQTYFYTLNKKTKPID